MNSRAYVPGKFSSLWWVASKIPLRVTVTDPPTCGE